MCWRFLICIYNNYPPLSLIKRYGGTSVRSCSAIAMKGGRGVVKEEKRKRHAREGVGKVDIRGRTRGAVSESAEYRTWSIKLLIVPESLVTIIATIIHRVSSTISCTKNSTAYLARPPTSLSPVASFLLLGSALSLSFLLSRLCWTRSNGQGWKDENAVRVRRAETNRSGLPLSAEAAATSELASLRDPRTSHN